MLYDDTIAAIATAPGVGAVGLLRLSGPQALTITQQVFRPARRGAWRPYRMRYGHVLAEDGSLLDEALAVYMRAPHSFTAEASVEVSRHGGPLVLARVLERLLAAGARAANPGEFTLRAFLNGRIDLAQAEAILDVVGARTITGLALAQQQLGGWLSGELRRAREQILAPLAYCTALVDFPEDDVEPHAIDDPIDAALATIERLLAGAEQGIIYRSGARAALIGRPNAGKSSLLNALLRADRAIVTAIPGTTRDTLEETANLCGIPVVLIDTAGIGTTSDPVEQLGIERSRQALASADLALLVVDMTIPIDAELRRLAQLTDEKPTILVLNKVDQVAIMDTDLAATYAMLRSHAFAAVVAVSALHGSGIDQLATAVAEVLLGAAPAHDAQLVSSPRHRDALQRAAAHLRDARDGNKTGVTTDLLAIDLTAALAALGEITGETVGDDLLNEIFSRFCIGK
ncbi:MAG TPA: tRNA uridine-5-carboxymethylaminomethyl(34) synthesis GTPase MnmE [Roseiflexaceae bacterium]|nr:tRNA uridine-5-carboxymethylaminomethyl(34) synthesis GTPase MnmE [Roseiflexaceae bacterium]